MKKKRHDEDTRQALLEEDDRTVANMNLEGMPWYREKDPPKRNPNVEKMSGKQAAQYTFYAVLAGLCIVAVFGVAAALFILFCTNIWFK